MSGGVAPAAFAVVALASCAQPKPASAPVPTAHVSAPPPALAAGATVPAAPSSRSPLEAPPALQSDPTRHLHIDLAPGSSCELLWQSGSYEATDTHWVIRDITGIQTQSGDACRAAPVWVSTDGDDVLVGGLIAKPGHERAVEKLSEGPPGGVVADFNFDGFRDLCVTAGVGARGYGQNCWLFDPETRTFVRYEKLDEVTDMTLDPKKKVITHSRRLGGMDYRAETLGWHDGELVVLERTDTTLGERPNGKPLPEGYRWEIVYRRRAGSLVKDHAGAVRDP